MAAEHKYDITEKYMDDKVISNIVDMESRLNRGVKAVEECRSAFDKLCSVQAELRVLFEYYGSKEWFDDRESDSRGELPTDLCRGVLTEDAVWELQADYITLLRDMRSLADKENI